MAEFHLAVCRHCEPLLPMPFRDPAERDTWGQAHANATGHTVARLDTETHDDVPTEHLAAAFAEGVQWVSMFPPAPRAKITGRTLTVDLEGCDPATWRLMSGLPLYPHLLSDGDALAGPSEAGKIPGDLGSWELHPEVHLPGRGFGYAQRAVVR
jgi:hypothetical protein